MLYTVIKLKKLLHQDGKFKIIDFGGAFILDNNKYFEFDKFVVCKVLTKVH